MKQLICFAGPVAKLLEWKFRQIAGALKFLFKEKIRTKRAAEYHCYQWRAYAREIEPDLPTLMRDSNPRQIRKWAYEDLSGCGGIRR